jgi:hypothetical protein
LERIKVNGALPSDRPFITHLNNSLYASVRSMYEILKGEHTDKIVTFDTTTGEILVGDERIPTETIDVISNLRGAKLIHAKDKGLIDFDWDDANRNVNFKKKKNK